MTRESDTLELCVTYNGKKISPSELEKESFYFLKLPEHRHTGGPRIRGKNVATYVLKTARHKYVGHLWLNENGKIRKDILIQDANFSFSLLRSESKWD